MANKYNINRNRINNINQDPVHQETDKKLNNLESRITEAYKQAYEDILEELTQIIIQIENMDRDNMTPQQKGLLATNFNRLVQLERKAAKRIKKASAISIDDINKTMVGIYGENYDFGIYQGEINSRMSTSFGLINHKAIKKMMKKDASVFDKIAFENIEDTAPIKRELQRELATSLILGESIPKMAKRIEKVTDKTRNQAITIARTETTRTENNARLDAFKKCEEAGIKLYKKWLATNDSRTRESHRALNGKKVKLEDEFKQNLRFPGDENAAAAEVVNCRCTMITEFEGIEKSSKLQALEDRVSKMDFEEWKEYKQEQE